MFIWNQAEHITYAEHMTQGPELVNLFTKISDLAGHFHYDRMTYIYVMCCYVMSRFRCMVDLFVNVVQLLSFSHKSYLTRHN